MPLKATYGDPKIFPEAISSCFRHGYHLNWSPDTRGPEVERAVKAPLSDAVKAYLSEKLGDVFVQAARPTLKR